jgi:PAS domain S-box-containing protein
MSFWARPALFCYLPCETAVRMIRHSFKATLGILFSVLTLTVLVIGLLVFQSNRAGNETSQLVEHSRIVMEQVNEAATAMRAAQQESNAIFFTCDTAFVSLYQAARQRMLRSVDNLARLTLGDSVQKETVVRLNQAIQELVSYTDVVLTMSEPYSREEMIERIARNSQNRAAVQAIIDEFRERETRLLQEGQKANAESVDGFNTWFAVLIGSVLIVIGATFIIVRYSFNKRLETEEALVKAKELFFSLFHESPVGLAISRRDDGRLIDCNLVYAKLANYSREDLIGNTPAQLGLIQNLDSGNVQQAGVPEPVYGEAEIQIYPKDKEPIWALVSVQPIHLQDQDCLLCAMIDVSSRKQAEKSIQLALDRERELNKMKSNFVTLASHEFRTPLTTVLSSAFLVENYITGENKEKAVKHLGRIKSSVNILTTILDDFLSLTRIEEGRMGPRIEPVDIPELIAGVCASLGTFVKPGQVINCRHTGNERAQTDPGMLTNALMNLLSNSIKYSPEGSVISVTSAVNGTLDISVRDKGIGIPQADQEMLFSRFYRASNAGNIQGTGLGLHLTRHYVELLNGTINFTSKVGEGTEFCLSLKL